MSCEQNMDMEIIVSPTGNYGIPLPNVCSTYRTAYDYNLILKWDKVANDKFVDYTKIGNCCSNDYHKLKRM